MAHFEWVGEHRVPRRGRRVISRMAPVQSETARVAYKLRSAAEGALAPHSANNAPRRAEDKTRPTKIELAKGGGSNWNLYLIDPDGKAVIIEGLLRIMREVVDGA